MADTMEKQGFPSKPDWGRYGLRDDVGMLAESQQYDGFHGDAAEDELFKEEEQHKPWWKANFFVREPCLFGTWDGVFTSCMINIFGVIIFLRTGWMVVS